MRTLSQDEFKELIKTTDLKLKIKADLRFIKSVEALRDDWSNYELVAISDRTGDKGVLLLQPYDELHIAQYELSRRIIDSKTGRSRAIICDFCYTWQPGSNAASISFTHAATKHKVRFLSCGDLLCSDHVRSTTKASQVSRSQLRENMSTEDRLDRLKRRLSAKISQLKLPPIA